MAKKTPKKKMPMKPSAKGAAAKPGYPMPMMKGKSGTRGK